MGMGTVITLDGEALSIVADQLARAVKDRSSVRVAIDDGGVKFSVGRGSWSPALGTVARPFTDPADEAYIERLRAAVNGDS